MSHIKMRSNHWNMGLFVLCAWTAIGPWDHWDHLVFDGLLIFGWKLVALFAAISFWEDSKKGRGNQK